MSAGIEPWGEGDLPLLIKLNDPETTRFVGGPETPEKVAERQTGYEEPGSRQYKVVLKPGGEGIGWVGSWEHDWRDQPVWEIGWAVLPSFQGRGIATSATAQLIELMRADRQRRFVHAFPRVENTASNAICRKLGFVILGEVELEVFRTPGVFAMFNDWRYDLFPGRSASIKPPPITRRAGTARPRAPGDDRRGSAPDRAS